MSRVGLDALGEHTTPANAKKTFCRIISILAGVWVLEKMMYAAFPLKQICSNEYPQCSYVFQDDFLNYIMNFLEFASGLYVLYIIIRTRSAIRKKSGIPPACCDIGNGAVDDCCTSFWCSCCVVGQMARHTADYNLVPDSCCTYNGLKTPENAVVV
mmetsp:Transcript_6376/g.13785  ORF Transcript_6376/g.13785 Transcript_6376/m.13785 type:complete len:156 (+) Transcript_6376:112-579(+)